MSIKVNPILHVVLVSLCSYGVSVFLPWWSIIIFPIIAGLTIESSTKRHFILGFLSIFILWFFLAYSAYVGHAKDLTSMIGELFGGLPSSLLLFITAIIGGLYGGLSEFTASLAKKTITS